jgi:glycosyltransferase involved in cell wall biosynthesis
MKKTVCILTSVHQPEDVRIYQKQAKSLRRAGYEVYLVNPSVTKTDEMGIHFVSADIPAMGRLKRIMTAPKKVYAVAKSIKADVYHFHDPELLGIGKKLGKNAKVIFDSHEDTPGQILGKDYIPKVFRKLISRCMDIREKGIARRLSAVVTATDTIHEFFTRKGCKNVVTVNNYPILDEFHPNVPFEQRENGVCYIGGITRIRGIHEVVNAAENANFKLLLAGTFETNELEESVKALNGFANTCYFGHVGRQEVADILSRSKVGLVTLYPVPNYVNSLPIKMFEYMAMGVPVVYSDFPFWRTLAGNQQDGVCGIAVDPYSPEDIRKACEYIIDHPQEAKVMAENGIRLVHEKYNWKREEEKLLALYENLLA